MNIEETPNGFAFPSISDFTSITGFPTLAIYCAGAFARYLNRLNDKEVLEQVIGTLEQMYQVENLQPVNYHISRWLTQPFFKGSYSFSNTDDTEQYIKILAQPIDNKVFFAGEATSTEGPGYVHGAYLSGILASQRIVKQ